MEQAPPSQTPRAPGQARPAPGASVQMTGSEPADAPRQQAGAIAPAPRQAAGPQGPLFSDWASI